MSRRTVLWLLLLASAPPLRAMRIEEVFVPMKDGTRLAATLYRPDVEKRGERRPVVFEYLPYRKDDGTFGEDYGLYSYMVAHGYIGARVDIRGTGRSEGHPPDREYSEQEQADGVEAIAWLARQPWSNGNVGMWGFSWGGFNSIQLAARRPPGLKAIIPAEATEDLFQDDIHYIDGLFHLDEYELSMEVQPAITRSPDYPLDEASLAARFDNPPWSLLYKKEQRDGPFWRRASLNPDRYDAIQIPALLIGGWYDGYRDSIPRMLEKLKSPVWAIVGPWNHSGPDSGKPGPPIEWRREAVRFFDRFLKGIDTGIEKTPRLAVYVRHSYAPDPRIETIPGEWRYEEGWPIRRASERTLHLTAEHTLASAPPPAGSHTLAYVPSAGTAAGFWWGEVLPDQRPADAFSLVYDSEPLTDDLEILGFPKTLLSAGADARSANWFVRLSDVTPGGEVTLVTGAGLSGAQRDSAADPKPLEPGKLYPLQVEMHFTSWVFPKGHRIRVAISNALWPMIWPTPFRMTTRLELGGAAGSRLVLPVIPAGSHRGPRPSFAAPEKYARAPGVRSDGNGSSWPGKWSICRDEVRDSSHGDWSGASAMQYAWGRIDAVEHMTYDVVDAHPESAEAEGEATTTITLPDRTLAWRANLGVRSDEKNFYYRLRRQLLRDGVRIREKTWEETIPRDLQ